MDDQLPKRLKHLEEAPTVAKTLGCGGGGGGCGGDNDRISNLPDAILCHILSKLPTKHAVATAILSTKWKHLFASIPNLAINIDDSLLLHPHHDTAATAADSNPVSKHLFASIPNLALDIDDSLLVHPHHDTATTADSNPVSHPRNTNFVNFIYHLLTVTLRDVPSICSFSLHCHEDYGNARIDAWISAVLGLQVSTLSMSLCTRRHPIICQVEWLEDRCRRSLERSVDNIGVSIHSLFHSETLVNLFWKQHCVVDVPDTVWLPNLKKLYLESLRFHDYNSFECILSGCPVLEKLCLDSCQFEEIFELVIFSPSLKSLILNNLCHDGFFDIQINTPALKFFYVDTEAVRISCANINSLLQAHIDVETSDVWDDEEFDQYDRNVAELVAACYNVEFLYLSMPWLTAIHHSNLVPIFHNLTELELGNFNSHGWKLMPHLLECAPNLEILVFTGGISDHLEFFTESSSCLPSDVPACLLLHLQSIYFEEFTGEPDEFKLVLYFLKNAEVLREMRVKFGSSLPLERQACISEELASLQRFSKNCTIEFTKEAYSKRLSTFWRMNEIKKMKKHQLWNED